MIKVLIIGSGGREHAFTWKASQSELVDKIFVAPGNAGTSLEPKAENIEISSSDIEGLVSFSKKENSWINILQASLLGKRLNFYAKTA